MRKFIFLIFLILFSTFITGCEKNEEICAIFVAILYEQEQFGVLRSDPIADPTQSEVIMKWDTLSDTSSYWYHYVDGIWFDNILNLDGMVDYTIELTSNVGDCRGTITFPDTTSIIEPMNYDTLPIRDGITISWNVAEGADYYEVKYGVVIYDSSGVVLDFYDTVKYVTLTSLTVPLGIEDASYYRIHFYLYPSSGSKPIPGERSNMIGSVRGFLTARVQRDWILFWVGEPVKNHKENEHMMKQTTRRELLNKYLEAFGIEQNYDEKFILP